MVNVVQDIYVQQPLSIRSFNRSIRIQQYLLIITMAYIGSHDGYGKTFHGFPTPDSFVLKHSIQDSPYPQDFNGRLQLPQIYTDLPCQELNAHCPACGHSD